MAIKYRINWESKETGATGHGAPVFNTLQVAEQIAEKLTRETPYLIHWVSAHHIDDQPEPAQGGE